jgi:hypothetical protein
MHSPHVEHVTARVAELSGVYAVVASFFDQWSATIGAVVAVLSLGVSIFFHIRRERLLKASLKKEMSD